MLKYIIIHEDSKGGQSLKNQIRKIPFLDYQGSFQDSQEAMLHLKSKPVDLIFLHAHKSPTAHDIVSQLFHLHAMVILIGANKEMAFEAYENNAVDFLLKPVLLERLLLAAEKAYKLKISRDRSRSSREVTQPKGGYIFIKESTRLVRLDLDDIYYVTGLKNYVSIMTKGHRIVSLQTMKQMEDLLPASRFMRVHRSYFVALDKIISVEKKQIFIKDKVIPIGNVFLPRFMKRLSK